MILYPFLIKTISTNLLTKFNNQKIETENKKVKKCSQSTHSKTETFARTSTMCPSYRESTKKVGEKGPT